MKKGRPIGIWQIAVNWDNHLEIGTVQFGLILNRNRWFHFFELWIRDLELDCFKISWFQLNFNFDLIQQLIF